MVRACKILLLSFTLMLLSSCRDTSIINEISLVLTSAYDLKDNQIHNGVLIGEYTDKDKSGVDLLEIDSTNSFDVMPRMNAQAKEPIEYGQLRVMVLGEAYVERGIADILQVLAHNTRVSRRMQMAVAEGEALELIKKSMKFNDPLFLLKLIEQNSNAQNSPHFSLHQALFQYFSKGQDVYLPRLRPIGEDRIAVDGVVVFKGDKAALQINEEEGLCLKLLTENAKNGKFLAPIGDSAKNRQTTPPGDDYALLKITSSSVKHRLLGGHSAAPAIETSVQIHASVIKAARNKFLLSGRDMKAHETEMKKHLETKINQLVRKFQQANVDPVAYGEYVRSCTPHWNSEKFYAHYGSMDIRVHVDLHLIQDGIVE